MFTVRIKQKSARWLEKLKLRYKQKNLEAAVGYPKGKAGMGNAHYPTTQSAVVKNNNKKKKADRKRILLGSGPSIIEVAIWNNFGTQDMPRRAFMELAAKWMQPEYRDMMKKAVRRINAGEIKLETVLKAAAVMGEGKVKEAIANGDWAPNSPATQELKGGNTPLKDSGDMLKYVTSTVRERTS